MSIVSKLHLGLLNPASTFDENVFGPVDHDVTDAGVLQQKFKRTETKRFVQNLLDQTIPLAAVQHRAFAVAKVFDDHADFAS